MEKGDVRGRFEYVLGVLCGNLPSFRRIPWKEKKGISPGRNRKKSAILQKTAGNCIPGRGRNRNKDTARRGAVSMLRFEYTYTLTPKTPKAPRTRRKYRTFLAFSIFCDIIRTRNINNTRYCFYVRDTKATTKKTSERKVKAL